MCKLMAFTDLSKLDQDEQSALMDQVQHIMSELERDGYGVMAQTESGLYIERTLQPKGLKIDLPFVSPIYNSVGTLGKFSGAAVFHGRTSTNHKTLINTHPISKHGWHLSHNGVVSHHGAPYKMLTTNDTEHLVELMGTKGISSIESEITGYYAFFAIDPVGNLHGARDSIAPLVVTYIDEIESFCFASKSEMIEDICEAMEWTFKGSTDVSPNSYFVMRKNKVISSRSIKPRGSTSVETKHSSKSLGVVLDATNPMVSEFEHLEYSQEAFLREMDTADSSYTVYNEHGREMSLSEFRMLEDADKVSCYATRYDGTEVDPTNYSMNRLG